VETMRGGGVRTIRINKCFEPNNHAFMGEWEDCLLFSVLATAFGVGSVSYLIATLRNYQKLHT